MVELVYKRMGDYLIFDLVMDGEDEMEEMLLGKYGRLWQIFFQEYYKGIYILMLLIGWLEFYLWEIDWQVQEQVDWIVVELKKQNGVDEGMKVCDQMGWVQVVNLFFVQVEEIVLNEIVYK